MKANSLRGAPAMVRNSALPGGGIRIAFREYLCDLISSATSKAFKLQAFRINPGDPNTFPWLSGIAINFQEYALRGLVFTFRSMSGDQVTTQSLGNVIMATDYDAIGPLFADKASMELSAYAQSVKPSVSCEHQVECAKRASPLRNLYVRGPTSVIRSSTDSNAVALTAPLAAGQETFDPRFYDFGVFQIATIGVDETEVNLGELWVSYEVELMKPISVTAQGSANEWMEYVCSVGVDEGSCLGTLSHGYINPNSTLRCTRDVTNIQKFNFPNGPAQSTNYLMVMKWVGDTRGAPNELPDVTMRGFTIWSPPPVGVGVRSFVTDAGTGITTVTQAPDVSASSDSTSLLGAAVFQVYGGGVPWDLTFSGGNIPEGSPRVQIMITQIALDLAWHNTDVAYFGV